MDQELLSKKELRKFLQQEAKRNPDGICIKRSHYNIYLNREWLGVKTNIFDFKNGKTYLEITDEKRFYVFLNEYLLTIGIPCIWRTNELDWEDIVSYSPQRLNVNIGNENLGTSQAKQWVIFDNKIIALCNQDFPIFFIIIDGNLTKLTTLQAERALQNLFLTAKDQAALLRVFPEMKWEEHNGILINSTNYEMPTSMHYASLGKRYRSRLPELDFAKIHTILSSFGEKNDIRYLSKESLL